MIRLNNVTKAYRIKGGWRPIIENFSLEIAPTDRLGILGRNGAGKSTLLRMIGAGESPDRGSIERTMRVSWPIGFSGYLQPSLTGVANTKFCARIYGRDIDETLEFVRDFSELGSYFDEPFRNYSSGMKARLGFALSMAIDFDCLLIDEVLAVGDARFKQKSKAALEDRREDSGFVIVNHDLTTIDRLCNKVLVLGMDEGPYISTRVHHTIKAYEERIGLQKNSSNPPTMGPGQDEMKK